MLIVMKWNKQKSDSKLIDASPDLSYNYIKYK